MEGEGSLYHFFLSIRAKQGKYFLIKTEDGQLDDYNNNNNSGRNNNNNNNNEDQKQQMGHIRKSEINKNNLPCDLKIDIDVKQQQQQNRIGKSNINKNKPCHIDIDIDIKQQQQQKQPDSTRQPIGR